MTFKSPPAPNPNSILPGLLSESEILQISEIFESLVTYASSKNNSVGFVYDPTAKKVVVQSEESPHHPLHHVSIRLIDLFTRNIATSENYFLLNNDVFLYHEPCCFCCMALIHSRVRRVWFIHPIENGSITKFKVPYAGVNHKMFCASVTLNKDIHSTSCQCGQ
ncbi:hypothetical protein GEMRC1_013094 [Eukaryota sp. GEM-RC1]